MTPPNFLLLTIDTLRADRLGAYGFPRSQTPNLDRLAAGAIRFNQAITGGTWTQAAFPVMITSSYASMYGGCLGVLSPTRPSPVEQLSQQGYATAAFSSNPHISKQFGYDRGFDTFVDLIPQATDPWLRSVTGGQALLRSPITHTISDLLGKNLAPAPVYVPAEDVTNSLCNWLNQTTAPFFAWAHYMDVHWPYHLDKTLTSPQKLAHAWQDLAHYHEASWNGAPFTTAHRDHYIGLYEQALSYLDEEIGRLLTHLESDSRFSNTVIIVVADHGEEFLDHGRWGHWENNLYDEIVRVPLLIRLPGQAHPQTIEHQVRTLDLMPTLLDLAGCAPLPEAEGTSLRPLWSGEETEYPIEEAICEMWRDPWHRIAIRTEKNKYIWDSRQPDQPELFDLINDPFERNNVAASHPELLGRFQEKVDVHLQHINDSQRAEAVPEPEMDEAILHRLRGLGYIE
ncbi:MAG: sulfatase [Candidatus Promineifilaceae bacterium]